MKRSKLYIVFIIVIILCLLISCQKKVKIEYETSDKFKILLPVKVNNKWGYINEEGKMVIKPQFKYANDFSEGYAWIILNDKRHAIINTKAEKQFYIKEGYKVYEFHDGYLRFEYLESKGYMNTIGEEIIPCKYTKAWDFKEGIAVVVENDKYGVINKKGEYIIKPIYEGMNSEFSEEVIGVKINGQWGYIDKKGNWVIDPKFNEDYVSRFSDGLAVVYRKNYNDNDYLINKKGIIIFENRFHFICPFNDGKARYSRKEKINHSEKYYEGVIDIHGNILWEKSSKSFHSDLYYSKGLLRAYVEDNRIVVWGFLDEKGEWAIFPQFEYVSDFKNGFARVEEDYILFFGKKLEFESKVISSGERAPYIWQLVKWKIYKHGHKMGYIDYKGNYIWEPTE
ncbi:WG repeat-containing protein [Candidatus Dependentiae bacterium]|nr:WG repeat-containing protein [Candidatus Dependentiae bacterium]